MRTIFRAMPFFGLALLLSACPPKVKVPEYQPPSVDEILNSLKTCAKPESEQTVSADAAAHVFTAKDKIDVMEIETVCDGQVTKRAHGPVRAFSGMLKLKAPAGLANLSFIQFENTRACSRGAIDVSPEFKSPAGVPEGTANVPFALVSQLGASGDVHLQLSGGTLRLFTELNVVEGRNVVQVRYYGTCLQYREPRDPKMGESYNCLKPQLLATRDFIVQVATELIEKPGVHTQRECPGRP